MLQKLLFLAICGFDVVVAVSVTYQSYVKVAVPSIHMFILINDALGELVDWVETCRVEAA